MRTTSESSPLMRGSGARISKESGLDTTAVRGKRGGIFYGWWLVGAGTIVLVMQGGILTYGFAAFFLPLTVALSTSRGSLSLAFSFTRLENGILGPIEGFLIDRFGPRRIMFIGYALFGVGFLLFSQVNSLLGFYLIFPLIVLGASLSGFLPVVTAVSHWFSRRRGLATGITAAGVNIGGILVVVVALAISEFGWRQAAVVIAVAVWLVGFPLSAMIRHRPQPYGYLPDGDMPETPDASAEEPASSQSMARGESLSASLQESPDFTPWQALRTPAFWFIAGSHSFSVLIIGAVTVHEIPLLVDAGLSVVTAASVLSFMTAVAVVGRVAGGFVGDIFGMRRTLVVCFFMMSIGVIILATTQTVPQALVFAVLYGLGYGARAPILIAIRADYFGPRNFATIMGLSQPIMMVGSFIGPIAAGYAYDVQGNYQGVFTVIALVNLVGALLVFFIKRPALPQRQEVRPATDT